METSSKKDSDLLNQIQSSSQQDITEDDDNPESGHGEIELIKSRFDCKKNPGHTQFIPIDTFTVQHLPERHRDNDLYELIKAVGDLTVRIDIQTTSPRRPVLWNKTTRLSSYYNRENRYIRTGSGMIGYVNKCIEGKFPYLGKHWNDSKKCWCTKCEHSDSPSYMWWEFSVDTATQVVFDDTEAKLTSLRLFYDDEDSPVKILDKVIVEYVNPKHDWCELKCVTCDKDIGEKLEKMWKHYDNKRRIVYNKYIKTRDVDKLTFIVSHPHGFPKKVSVGRWEDKVQVGDVFNKFTYTACTCPGSSGANVHCVGYIGWWRSAQLVHSGSRKGVNYSGIGFVM